MDRDRLSMAAFAHRLLGLCEERIHRDPTSAAAKDAEERIDAAFAGLIKGSTMETLRWVSVVGSLGAVAARSVDVEHAVAEVVGTDPWLLGHESLVRAAVERWRADHGKWDATLRLLDATGLYKSPPRHRADKPAEYLRQRWAQEVRKGVPLAYRTGE